MNVIHIICGDKEEVGLLDRQKEKFTAEKFLRSRESEGRFGAIRLKCSKPYVVPALYGI